MKDIKTQAGISLLSSETFVKIVNMIEKETPGWWWSISQRPNQITLSLGPGRNCPHLHDVSLSHTKSGDEGYIQALSFDHGQGEDTVVDWVGRVQYYINTLRDISDSTLINPLADYRFQTEELLDHFVSKYDDLLNEAAFIENEGYVFGEIYFGSCDLSIDCSLRGVDSKGQQFDIGIDLTGRDDGLGDSVYWATCEIKSEILTERWEKEQAEKGDAAIR